MTENDIQWLLDLVRDWLRNCEIPDYEKFDYLDWMFRETGMQNSLTEKFTVKKLAVVN